MTLMLRVKKKRKKVKHGPAGKHVSAYFSQQIDYLTDTSQRIYIYLKSLQIS